MLTIRNRSAFILPLLCVAAGPSATQPADRLLEEAERNRVAEIRRAQAEFDKATAKLQHDRELADAKLVKAYDDAIKRTVQRGDLEGANQLLARKKQWQAETRAAVASTTQPAMTELSAPAQLRWTPIKDDGTPPTAFALIDVPSNSPDAEIVRAMNAGRVTGKIADHDVVRLAPNDQHQFRDFGLHNIQTSYCAFYLRCDSAQTTAIVVSTTQYGSLRVWLDGEMISQHDGNNHEAYEEKIGIQLKRGDHVVVVRHMNGWDDCHFGFKIGGGNVAAGQ